MHFINLINDISYQLIGIAFLGLSSSILGVFVVLNKKALVGDVLSHVSLPGIVFAYYLHELIIGPYYIKKPGILVLIIGAFAISMIALFLIEIIKKYSHIQYDAILALILSSFFGLGQILLSIIQQKTSNPFIAQLEKLTLGQIASISKNDVYTVVFISFLVLIIIFLFKKELKIFIFDPSFAQSVGINVTFMKNIINILVIIVVIIGLRIAGIILMSAFMIAPAISSRQWSDNLKINIFLASLFSLIAGFLGAILSVIDMGVQHVPTGPIIVIFLSLFVFVSLYLAPKHGILKTYFQSKKYQKKIQKYKFLIHIYNQKDKKIHYENYNLNSFFLKQKYLIYSQNKIILTFKGQKLVEQLIKGEFHD
jgi:ABC-type Mn2+/Zn2+ transport system permease subunit